MSTEIILRTDPHDAGARHDEGMTSTCPACGTPLATADEHCPRCGLPLRGPVAGELGHVDRQLAVLGARRHALLDQLRRESGAPPPAPARSVALPVDRSRTWSAQQMLLGLGVLLVVVAGLVFVAVAWRALGVGGQVAVVAGAAGATCVASRLLERRALTASAGATAALGSGLLAVGLGAARELGLADLAAVGWFAYSAVTATLLALVCLLAGFGSRSRAWGVLAVVAGSAAVLLGLRAADPGWFGYALVLALAAVAAHGLGRVPSRWVLVRAPGRVAGVSFAVATWCVAPLAAWGDRSAQAPACAVVGVTLAVLVLRAGSGHGGATRLRVAHRGLGLVGAVAAGTQLAAACSLQPSPVRAGAVLLAAAGLVAAGWLRPEWRRSWAGAVALTAVVTAVLVGLDLLVDLRDDVAVADLPVRLVRDTTWWSLLVAVLALVVSGLLVARRQPAHGAPADALVVSSLLVGTTVAASASTLAVLVASLAAVATGLAVWAYRSRGAEEVVLVAGAVIGELAAFAVAFSADTVTPAAAVLSLAGVVALAYGFRPGRAWLWWVGAVAVPAGSWLWLLEHEVETVEAFSLPLAGLCLLAGALGLVRRRSLSSWAVAGPAITAALMPSAVASVSDEGVLRPLLLLAAGTVLLVVGVLRRRQALVVVPAVAVAVVAVSQLAPWAVGLPRWLSLGAAGVLLLAVGVRYESRRRHLVSATHWVQSLG